MGIGQSFRTAVRKLNSHLSRGSWLFILVSAVLIFLLVRAYRDLSRELKQPVEPAREATEHLSELHATIHSHEQRIKDLEEKIEQLEDQLTEPE